MLKPIYFYIVAAIILIGDVILLVFHPEWDAALFASGLGAFIGFASIAIALKSKEIAIGSNVIAESADNKMGSISQLLFSEKLADLNKRLVDAEGELYTDEIYIDGNFTISVLLEIEASISVLYWVEDGKERLKGIISQYIEKSNSLIKAKKDPNDSIRTDFLPKLNALKNRVERDF